MKVSLSPPNKDGVQSVIVTHGHQYPFKKTPPAMVPEVRSVDREDFWKYLKGAIDDQYVTIGKQHQVTYNQNKE